MLLLVLLFLIRISSLYWLCGHLVSLSSAWPLLRDLRAPIGRTPQSSRSDKLGLIPQRTFSTSTSGVSQTLKITIKTSEYKIGPRTISAMASHRTNTTTSTADPEPTNSIRLTSPIMQSNSHRPSSYRLGSNHASSSRVRSRPLPPPPSKRRRDPEDSAAPSAPASKAPRTTERTGEIDLTGGSRIDLTEESQSHVDLTRESRPVPQIDLTGHSGSAHMSQALEMQRRAEQQAKDAAAKADAQLLQSRGTPTEEGRTTLTAYKCPVCMDTPENATSTLCGKLSLARSVSTFLLTSQ